MTKALERITDKLIDAYGPIFENEDMNDIMKALAATQVHVLASQYEDIPIIEKGYILGNFIKNQTKQARYLAEKFELEEQFDYYMGENK